MFLRKILKSWLVNFYIKKKVTYDYMITKN